MQFNECLEYRGSDKTYNEKRLINKQGPKRKQRGGTWILNSMKMCNMKDTQDSKSYINIEKQWDYRL